MKVALVCPAGTVTVAGMVTFALLLASETANPLLGAASVKDRPQDVLPGVLSVMAVQISPPKEAPVVACVIVPDPPVVGIVVPSAVEATTLASCTGIVVVDGLEAIWNVAVATVPSAMTLPFRPKIRQMLPEQETDLPAFVAEGPAATVTPVMSDEKLKVHWRPAVWAPPGDVILIGRETVPPVVPGPDPTDNVTLCAKAVIQEPSNVKRMK